MGSIQPKILQLSSAPISVIPDPDDPYNNSVLFDPKKHKLPDFIKRHTFKSSHSKRNVAFYTAEAKNEKAVILGGSGLKNDFPIPPDQIETLNNAGYSILWVALPNPIRNDNFVEHFVHIAEELITNPENQIMKEWLSKDVPKLFFGYSTTAQLFFHLLRENRTFDTLTKDFKGAVVMSPYLRPPNLDKEGCLKERLLRMMARNHPDRVSLETRLGAGYYLAGLKDKTDVPGLLQIIRNMPLHLDPNLANGMKYTTPTFQQMIELMDHGLPILKDSFNSSSNICNRSDFPILMITGKNDSYAGADINRAFADRANIALYESPNSKHAVAYEDPKAIQIMIGGYDSMLTGTFDQTTHALKHWDQKIQERTSSSLLSSMQLLPSLGRLRPHMPSVFSRTHS